MLVSFHTVYIRMLHNTMTGYKSDQTDSTFFLVTSNPQVSDSVCSKQKVKEK